MALSDQPSPWASCPSVPLDPADPQALLDLSAMALSDLLGPSRLLDRSGLWVQGLLAPETPEDPEGPLDP